jgi:hypothetical protein
MKKYIIMAFLSIIINIAHSQTLNWANLQDENKHIVNARFGLDFGINYALGYGYKLKTKSLPIIANIEFSMPSGDKVFDDFKTKTGVQIRWFEYHNIRFSTSIQGVFRRFDNNLVQLVNFGSDMSGVIGYYRPKWFAAAELGFDKAIVTHFKHKKAYTDNFPQVQDGWYEPATGGNFNYGLQVGFSFKKSDIYLKAGKLLTQDFKTTPLLPFYAELGFNRRF